MLLSWEVEVVMGAVLPILARDASFLQDSCKILIWYRTFFFEVFEAL